MRASDTTTASARSSVSVSVSRLEDAPGPVELHLVDAQVLVAERRCRSHPGLPSANVHHEWLRMYIRYRHSLWM